MNDLNLNDTTLDLFDSYTKNQLNEKEKAAFNERLAQDSSFNSTFQSFLISRDVINEKIEASLREQMKQWNADRRDSIENEGTNKVEFVKPTGIKKLDWTKYAAAASVLILLSIGILQYRSTKSFPGKLINEQLPLEVYATREANQASSSIDVDQMVKELLNKPSNENYQKVKTALADLSPSDPNYSNAQDLLIKVAVRTNDKDLANQALKNSKSVAEKTMFIELLFMLQAKTPRNALNEKINEYMKNYSTGSYSDEVKKIQNRINSISWRLFH